MSKTGDLEATIQELRDMAAKANGIADWLSDIFINQQADADEADEPAMTLEDVVREAEALEER
jgi:hypothetical protein